MSYKGRREYFRAIYGLLHSQAGAHMLRADRESKQEIPDYDDDSTNNWKSHPQARASIDRSDYRFCRSRVVSDPSDSQAQPGFISVHPRILIRENADDYLREMALADNPPSRTVYRQGGRRVSSLGVFEHWDNDATRQYSRNKDPRNGKGIELLYLPME